MLALLCLQSTAFMLTPRAAPHIAKAAPPPRAAVSAIFGHDNEHDLRKAAAATLASIVILASPTAAFAKGGGHGGGGGGGGGGGHGSYHGSSSSSAPATRSLHSYTRYASPKAASAHSQGRRGSSPSSRRGRNGRSSVSSSRSAPSAATFAPPPPPALIFPSESKAREEGGYYCPAEPPLPKRGDHLNVAQRKATVLSSTPQVALYGSQLQTIPGLDADCSVTVQYDDDGTIETLSAAEKAQPLWVKYLDLELLGAAYGGMGLMSALEPSSWEAEKKRHQAMVEELKPSSARTPARPEGLQPKSGEYWGSSEESDDGDQAVRSTINFKAIGEVHGRGTDGEDGPYKITQGVWGQRDGDLEHEVTVGWIEEYSQGFQVVVEGFYNTKTGKIEARFRSSLGVSGRFMLVPKPSIFS